MNTKKINLWNIIYNNENLEIRNKEKQGDIINNIIIGYIICYIINCMDAKKVNFRNISSDII